MGLFRRVWVINSPTEQIKELKEIYSYRPRRCNNFKSGLILKSKKEKEEYSRVISESNELVNLDYQGVNIVGLKKRKELPAFRRWIESYTKQ